jgi:hypothetical protein
MPGADVAWRHEAPPDMHKHVLVRAECEFTVEPEEGRHGSRFLRDVQEDGSEKALSKGDVYLQWV